MLWDGCVLSFGPLVRLLALGALSAAAGAAAPAASLPPVDFSREVRPILSDKCYHCHGPDEQGRKAQLRFDTREGALRIKDDFAVIVPGHSAESELMFRIKSTDDEEIMPPPDAKIGRLTPDEIATLQRWCERRKVPDALVVRAARTRDAARPDHFDRTHARGFGD
jgi:hypothetical protein